MGFFFLFNVNLQSSFNRTSIATMALLILITASRLITASWIFFVVCILNLLLISYMKLKNSARWMRQILEWTVSNPAILNVFFFFFCCWRFFPVASQPLSWRITSVPVLFFNLQETIWAEKKTFAITFSLPTFYISSCFFFSLTASARRAIRRLMNCNTVPANKWFPFFFYTNHQRSGGWLFYAQLKGKLNGRQADVAFS